MEKEFIPYTEALSLKELGFDENCFRFYLPNKKLITSEEKRAMPKQTINCICAPTFSQAFRWFREKYKYTHIWQMDELLDTGEYSYEEAELECLKKLIETVKEK